MKKLLNNTAIYLLSLNKSAFELCHNRAQLPYRKLVVSLFIVSLGGMVAGFDIVHNFTTNQYVLAASALVGGLLIFYIDYSFLTADAKWYKLMFRFLFATVVNSIAAISLIALFFSNDIDNRIKLIVESRITQVDSTYNSEKENRYAQLNTLTNLQNEYHQNICQPEAMIGGAYGKYDEKHAKCIKDLTAIRSMKFNLDSNETPFIESYHRKIAVIKSEKSDFSERYVVLFTLVKESAVKLVLFCALFLVIFYLDMQAISNKLAIREDDDYHQHRDYFEQVYSSSLDFIKQSKKVTNAAELVYNHTNTLLSSKNVLEHLKRLIQDNAELASALNPMKEMLENEIAKTENIDIEEELSIDLPIKDKVGGGHVQNEQEKNVVNDDKIAIPKLTGLHINTNRSNKKRA